MCVCGRLVTHSTPAFLPPSYPRDCVQSKMFSSWRGPVALLPIHAAGISNCTDEGALGAKSSSENIPALIGRIPLFLKALIIVSGLKASVRASMYSATKF